jgi:hypothetical protein
MSKKVSESAVGQGLPKPSRAERDESYSAGAGRKAVEVPLEEDFGGKEASEGACTHAPVGLELETQARELDDYA